MTMPLVILMSVMAWRSGRGAETEATANQPAAASGGQAESPSKLPATGEEAVPSTLPAMNADVRLPVEFGEPEDTIMKRIPKLEMYPCSDCHGTPEDFHYTPRTLTEEHTDKKVHFRKRPDSEAWCHRCHMPGNYLKLRLRSGEPVSLNEAYLVCGECHGTQFNDWRRNIHGKRIGQWNGPKQVASCPECHDPHAPAFKPIKPEPMPIPPRGRSKSFLKLLFGDMIREKGEVQQETQPSH